MPDTLHSKLEASRKELLDLGLKNPLIHYKQPKGKGLHITQEKATSVYDLLVRQNKAMSFVGRKSMDNTQELIFDELKPDELESSYTDLKLQTNESETVLLTKLLNTYYAARTSIEEQGVNILYITLGMLQWYESPAGNEPKLAPLVLIPVTLERSSATERFRIKYSLEEIGHNLSLQAKLKAEFSIALPDLPLVDELSIPDYLQQVSSALGSQTRWNVIHDHIELGFFSFGKFMIYHDLDNSKWPEDQKPVVNPILMSLFGEGFKDTRLQAQDDAFIDNETNAHELFQVVDADSSQLLSMLAVNEGKHLVIQGPPGTGKSQTITNIIANAIGQGKKVLFVAEKMAALEVVKRRMDNIGLGEACLELHSHKSNKKDLHQELKRVIELGKPQIQKLQEEVGLLGRYKKEINDYSIAINSVIGNSGVTVHQVYGYLLNIQSDTNNSILPRIQIPNLSTWRAEDQVNAEAVAERVQARLKDIGIPSKMLFWGSELRVLLPHDQTLLNEAFQLAIQCTEKIRNESGLAAQKTGFNIPVNREKSIHLSMMLQLASVAPDLKPLNIVNHDWLLRGNDIEEMLSIGNRISKLSSDFTDIFLPEAWQQDVLEIRRSIMEHGNKWYKFLLGDYNKAVKVLKSVCKGAVPKETERKIQYVDAILEHKRLVAALNEHEQLAKSIFGLRWERTNSKWESLEAAAFYLKTVHQQVADGSCDKEILAYLGRYENPSVARQAQEFLLACLNEQATSIQSVEDKLKLIGDLKFQNKSLIHLDYESLVYKLNEWVKGLSELQLAVSWNNLVDLASESNLQCLTDAVIDWAEGKDYLKAALQKTWFNYLLEQSIHGSNSLRQFERVSHEEAINQFRKIDVLSLRYNRAQAALKHWSGMPNLDAGGQLSILKTEFNRKARHLPIRKLMQEAGQAVQAIKPVFMMSPLSIANFLAPGVLEFDLVIFDEASQVRPVEALGAILRGKQLVVVGDTKQLPPTTFFDTLNDNTEDDENVTADLQSILGMCDAQGAPQKMLRWHYRSRHESLISLSNHEFYENRLVVFPSPGSRHNLGLIFHHLKDTMYDRGQTRTNPKEAQIVAGAVMEHARKYPKLSLGVAAFSSAQREAIQNALELLRRANPGLEDYFRSHSEEPFFIKNLENVQGDERDVIFISIGYGRTQEGYVSMSFGPLNNEGGEKRLNVLITRAKLRCEVFTNLTSSDIDTSKSQKRGIKALKSFLHFAQHGKLDVPVETGKPFDSPFEERVYDDLVRLGYTVRQQVGSQGFYLDLAIVDPEHPGRYLLGIECDGAAYHSARSARDRDRLRQQVLEGIGWRIHRIWSTDWFRNPERELKRAVEAIEKAKLRYQAEDEITGEEEIIESHFAREHLLDDVAVPLYEFAVLPPAIGTKELHMHPVGALSGWVVEVVTKESPVHFDEVARRMAEAAGIARVGSRIRDQLLLATKFAEGSQKIIRKGDFLWAAGMQAAIIRDRSNVGASSKKLKYISPEELSLGTQKIINDSIAIGTDEAISMIAKLFGFSRVTEEMRKELLEVVRLCVTDGKIAVEGTVLRPKLKEVL